MHEFHLKCELLVGVIISSLADVCLRVDELNVKCKRPPGNPYKIYSGTPQFLTPSKTGHLLLFQTSQCSFNP